MEDVTNKPWRRAQLRGTEHGINIKTRRSALDPPGGASGAAPDALRAPERETPRSIDPFLTTGFSSGIDF
eukprot:9468126-Pyramimonas_sp.AAC.1